MTVWIKVCVVCMCRPLCSKLPEPFHTRVPLSVSVFIHCRRVVCACSAGAVGSTFILFTRQNGKNAKGGSKLGFCICLCIVVLVCECVWKS